MQNLAAEVPGTLWTDFETCITHLRPLITRCRATRTTNLLERFFAEERRRLQHCEPVA